jgi:molybdate-binding protein
MRLVVREPESGAQRLLERCLRAVGLPARLPGAELLRAPGHLEVARLIDADAADAGIASRDASVAFGLGFVPLASERFDLVLESSFRDDKRLARLLDELATGTCRAELASLGYGVRESGAHVTDLAA